MGYKLELVAEVDTGAPVAKVRFDPKAKRIASIAADRSQMTMWSFERRGKVSKLFEVADKQGATFRFTDVCFLPDSDRIILAGLGRKLSLLDAGRGTSLREFGTASRKGDRGGYVSVVVNAEESRAFATGWGVVEGEVFRLPSGRRVGRFWGTDGPDQAVWHPEGRLLATAMNERTGWLNVQIVGVGEELEGYDTGYILGTSHGVFGFSPDGRKIVGVGGVPPTFATARAFPSGALLFKWNEPNVELPPLEGAMSWISGIAFSPASDRVLVPSREGLVELTLDIPEADDESEDEQDIVVRRFDVHDAAVTSLDVRYEDRLLATASVDGMLRVWNSPYQAEVPQPPDRREATEQYLHGADAIPVEEWDAGEVVYHDDEDFMDEFEDED